MADSKQVAERLEEFAQAADHIINRRGFQTQVRYASAPRRPLHNRTEVYEACIAKLDEPDRDEFARILEAMFAALGAL